MKLILEREQRSAGMMSKRQVFSVTFRAEVDQKDRDMIDTLKLADDELYSSHDIIDPGAGLLGLASRMAMKNKIKTLNVRELVNGKTIECENIVEMKAVEGQVIEAAENLKAILDTAATFGGREVIEL
jgi:hypothetical protein